MSGKLVMLVGRRTGKSMVAKSVANMVRIQAAWKDADVSSPPERSPWADFPGGYDNWRARRDYYEKLKYRLAYR